MRRALAIGAMALTAAAPTEEAPAVPATAQEFSDLRGFAEAYIRERLVDPESAQFSWPSNFMHGASWKPWIGRSIYGSMTCGIVNSRNRMGGYVGRTYFAIVIGDGGINWFEMDDTQHVRVRNRCATLDLPPAPVDAPKATDEPAPVSVADEIRKLGELRDKGLITQEEFDQQKRKLLGI